MIGIRRRRRSVGMAINLGSYAANLSIASYTRSNAIFEIYSIFVRRRGREEIEVVNWINYIVAVRFKKKKPLIFRLEVAHYFRNTYAVRRFFYANAGSDSAYTSLVRYNLVKKLLYFCTHKILKLW